MGARSRKRSNTIAVAIILAILVAAGLALTGVVAEYAHAQETNFGLSDLSTSIESDDLQQVPIDLLGDADPTTLRIVVPPASGVATLDHTVVRYLPDPYLSTTVSFVVEVASAHDAKVTQRATFTYDIAGLDHKDTDRAVARNGSADYATAPTFHGYQLFNYLLEPTLDDHAEQSAGRLSYDSENGVADWAPTGVDGRVHINYNTGVITFHAGPTFHDRFTYSYQAKVGDQALTGHATFVASGKTAPVPDLGLTSRVFPGSTDGGPATMLVENVDSTVTSAAATVDPSEGTATAELLPAGAHNAVKVMFTPTPGFHGDAAVVTTVNSPKGPQTARMTFPVTTPHPVAFSATNGASAATVTIPGASKITAVSASGPAGGGHTSLDPATGKLTYTPPAGATGKATVHVALGGTAAAPAGYSMTLDFGEAPGSGFGSGKGDGAGGGSGRRRKRRRRSWWHVHARTHRFRHQLFVLFGGVLRPLRRHRLLPAWSPHLTR